MQNIVVRYGLYYAVALCVGFVGSYLIFGNDPENYTKSEILGYSIMLFTSVVVVFAIREAKQQRNNSLSFVRGFGIGLGVSAIGACSFAIYNWVYVVWLHPEFLGEYMAYHEAQIRGSGLSDSAVQQQLSELATYSDLMSNPLMMAAVMFFTVFVIGSLFGLVAAFAFRAKGS